MKKAVLLFTAILFIIGLGVTAIRAEAVIEAIPITACIQDSFLIVADGERVKMGFLCSFADALRNLGFSGGRVSLKATVSYSGTAGAKQFVYRASGTVTTLKTQKNIRIEGSGLAVVGDQNAALKSAIDNILKRAKEVSGGE